MSEKVKLPKEVAESIKWIRGCYKTDCEYDLDFIKKENIKVLIPIIDFTSESRENMARYFRALVNGYEVELTPKERAIEYLSKLNGPHSAYHSYSEHDAIVGIMQILGVK